MLNNNYFNPGKFINHHHECSSNYIFSNDVCFEIMSYLDSSFVIRNCYLISKQWSNVIINYIKVLISFKRRLDDDMVKFFASSQLKVISLTFDRYTITTEQFITLIPLLKQLTYLCINGNQIENVKFIEELKELKTLDIGHNRIGNQLCKHYISNELKQLQSLNICDNSIGLDRIKLISEMKQLTSLDVSDNGLGWEAAQYISELKQLVNLNISNNYIGYEGVKYICKMKQLTSLDIGSTKLGDAEAICISELEQLQSLDISSNHITNEGFQYIIGAMRQLTCLDISYNRIDEELIERSKLKHLTHFSNRTYSTELGKNLVNLSEIRIANFKNKVNKKKKTGFMQCISYKH